MNRAAAAHLPVRSGIRWFRPRLDVSGDGDGEQRSRCRPRITQLALLKQTPPLEYLVRVHSVCPRDLRHTRTRFHRQLHDLQLLRSRPTPSAPTPYTRIFCMDHAVMLIRTIARSPEGNFPRLLDKTAPKHYLHVEVA